MKKEILLSFISRAQGRNPVRRMAPENGIRRIGQGKNGTSAAFLLPTTTMTWVLSISKTANGLSLLRRRSARRISILGERWCCGGLQTKGKNGKGSSN